MLWNILQRFMPKKSQIKYTALSNIFTKYGLFQAQMYKQVEQELLVIISLNFCDVDNPVIYFHSDNHHCEDHQCGFGNHLDIAMRTIAKEGGMVIYSSQNSQDMDNLLRDIKASKLAPQNKVMTGSNLVSYLKGYRGQFLMLDYLLKKLKLSMVRLITDNPNIRFIIDESNISVTKQMATIAFTYGNNQPSSMNELIEAPKAISFEYNNTK